MEAGSARRDDEWQRRDVTGGVRAMPSPSLRPEQTGAQRADWLDRDRAWRRLAGRVEAFEAALASLGEPTCLLFAAGDPVARCERLARGLGLPVALVATVILRECPRLRELVLVGWVA